MARTQRVDADRIYRVLMLELITPGFPGLDPATMKSLQSDATRIEEAIDGMPTDTDPIVFLRDVTQKLRLNYYGSLPETLGAALKQQTPEFAYA